MIHKRYPAYIKQTDKMDFVGLTSFTHYTYFVDKVSGFRNWYINLGTNLPNSRYPNWLTEPRMVGDINGDGFSDLIGFDHD